jgi:hypothetical protein
MKRFLSGSAAVVTYKYRRHHVVFSTYFAETHSSQRNAYDLTCPAKQALTVQVEGDREVAESKQVQKLKACAKTKILRKNCFVDNKKKS